MKIFVLEGNYASYNIPGISPLTEKETSLGTAMYMVPDTALLTHNRPFFVPDEAWPCTVQAHLAVRICRLGKHVSERFAHRYYDALSVAATFTAQETFTRLRAQGLPWEVSKGFDGAVAIGAFLEKETAARSFCLNRNGETLQPVCSEEELLQGIDSLIAAISRYYKLCHGDLILTGTPGAGAEVHINDHLEGYLGNEQVLAFNVK